MKQIAALQFSDDETGEADLVIIKVTKGQVVLALSQESNGDVQVVLRADDCQKVVDALERALTETAE